MKKIFLVFFFNFMLFTSSFSLNVERLKGTTWKTPEYNSLYPVSQLSIRNDLKWVLTLSNGKVIEGSGIQNGSFADPDPAYIGSLKLISDDIITLHLLDEKEGTGKSFENISIYNLPLNIFLKIELK